MLTPRLAAVPALFFAIVRASWRRHRSPRSAICSVLDLSCSTGAVGGMPRTGRFLGLDLLATALARDGRLDEAIAALQLYDVSSVRLMENFPWLHCRWQLAQLLRRRGRVGEARKVEAELLHYLSQADDESPTPGRAARSRRG